MNLLVGSDPALRNTKQGHLSDLKFLLLLETTIFLGCIPDAVFQMITNKHCCIRRRQEIKTRLVVEFANYTTA